jgi:predicted GNAT superfamily acetyltransferase
MTADEFTIRPLESHDDFLQCVALQHETWGADFVDSVPPSILQVCQKVGGVAAGAFDGEGRLVGFVFGLSGVRHGRLAHWSDMLAVREELRGRGLGQRLKAFQLSLLLERGIEVAYWTYDPLEAGNANININRLAAFPVEYVPDMYGEATSTLHAGLSTDRFVVEWWLTRDDRRGPGPARARASRRDAGSRRDPLGHPGDKERVVGDGGVVARQHAARVVALPGTRVPGHGVPA